MRPTRQALVLTLLTVAMAGVTACQADAESQLPPHLQARVADAPPEQRAALADGRVTFAEYEAAVQKTVACIRSSGTEAFMDLQDPAAPGQPHTYGIGIEHWPGMREGDLNELYDRCSERHQGVIGAVYSHQHTDHRLVDEYLENYRGGG